MTPQLIVLMKQAIPVVLLALAWLVYIVWGVRWLRGARRIRLF